MAYFPSFGPDDKEIKQTGVIQSYTLYTAVKTRHTQALLMEQEDLNWLDVAGEKLNRLQD